MAVVAGCAVVAAEYADLFRPLTLPGIGASAPVAMAWRPQAPRLAYRYSIVPGGVWSADDVVQAIEDDPVVAAHYHRLDLSRLRSEVLAEPRTAYVSYRTGQDIGWTSRRVQVGAGEAVLTDGTTTIRARCGNVLSDEAVADAADERFDPAVLDQIDPDPSFAIGRPAGTRAAPVSAADGIGEAAGPPDVSPVAMLPALSRENSTVSAAAAPAAGGAPAPVVGSSAAVGGSGGFAAGVAGGVILLPPGARDSVVPEGVVSPTEPGFVPLDPPLAGAPGLGGGAADLPSPVDVPVAVPGSEIGSDTGVMPLVPGLDPMRSAGSPGQAAGPDIGLPNSGGPSPTSTSGTAGSGAPTGEPGGFEPRTVPEPFESVLVLLAAVGWWLYTAARRRSATSGREDVVRVDGTDRDLASFPSEHECDGRRGS
jgi:hypothetical protein